MSNEKTQATEEKEKETVELTSAEVRQKEKDACNREIAAVLDKYNCNLTAQMVITEKGNVPQVFLIDARG